jgi:hypothetical protein
MFKRKRFNIYATQDAGLPLNSWVVKNANFFVAEGKIDDPNGDFATESKNLVELIDREERINFNKLEMFIARFPGNHVAMDFYCDRAAKYLPDQRIENQIYKYVSITHTPIAGEMYSGMQNKSEWNNLIPKIITKSLYNLIDAPDLTRTNPWNRLQKWEELDISKFAIDWYDLLHNQPFWFPANYYTSPIVMNESIFIKYIRGAAKANDWKAVLDACESRYILSKSNCKNEQILEAWGQAEEKLKVQRLL